MLVQPVYSRRALYQPLPIKPTDRGLLVKLTTLTDVELHLLLAIAQGKKVKEIAKLFGRTIKTVRENRQTLLLKLVCKDSVDLTRAAVELGLIDPQSIQNHISKSGQYFRVLGQD